MTHLKNPYKMLFSLLQLLGCVTVALLVTTTPVWADETVAAPQSLLREALDWVAGLGAVGAIAFIALYSLAAVAFLPASVLTLGGGALFGVVRGAIYVFIGATVGATLSFLIGRYLVRGWVSEKIGGNSRFKAIDAAVEREGFKIVALTRLSPVFPFNLLNYIFGITGVSLRDYLLGCIGMIPGTLLYVYIGSLAGDIATLGTASQPINATATWVIRLLGLIATLVITLYVTHIARQALQQVAPDDPLSTDS